MIDLRSDTVTRPTPAMRDAMMRAPLGDDVLGDEPTVQLLEKKIAEMLGFEAALYVPSGTMSNQLAIRCACDAGDEIIAHRDSHVIHYETGAPAALSGCMIWTLDGPNGMFDAEQVAKAIRHADVHNPISRMLIIENTHNRGGGSVWPLDRFKACCDEAHKHGLHVHLDGARLMNAATALGVSAREYTKHVDTVSICFSKGLGAPVGSALCGKRDLIHRARRFRKMLGGGMRQSGILAAACIYALDNNLKRLAEDHANAKRLAAGLAKIPGLRLQNPPEETPTNMVFFYVPDAPKLCAKLEENGVRMIDMDPTRVRAVTHLDVTSADIDRAIELATSVLTK